jgi:hypothetical protein
MRSIPGENEMRERPRDDTPERDERSPEKEEPKPGSYYYDDSTGYEIYDPEKDDEEVEEKDL